MCARLTLDRSAHTTHFCTEFRTCCGFHFDAKVKVHCASDHADLTCVRFFDWSEWPSLKSAHKNRRALSALNGKNRTHLSDRSIRAFDRSHARSSTRRAHIEFQIRFSIIYRHLWTLELQACALRDCVCVCHHFYELIVYCRII